jgi:hypothetical protein
MCLQEEDMMERFGVGMNRQTFGVGVLGAILLLIAVVFATGTATSQTATCTNPNTLGTGAIGSAFEIDLGDANLVVNTSGCIDWVGQSELRQTDTATGAGDDSFGQGTAENNPNPTIVDGSIPPNKSDLKAFGVFTEAKYLELFWSRVQNPSGTTNMDFELNKEFCDGTATHCANNGTRKVPLYVTPKRTSGDKLITYDLSQGGTNPSISIRTWTGSQWGPATLIETSGATAQALGAVNTNTIFAGASDGLGQQDPYTFGEAAISFQALFGSECGTFGSAYLKSRSSDSFTSEIKDFVPPERVNISNCPAGITSQQSFIPQDTATITGAQGSTLTGDVKFILYRTQAACDADTTNAGTGSVYSETKTLNNAAPFTVSTTNDGNAANGGPATLYTINSTNVGPDGKYVWGVSYSGDAFNNAARSCVEDSSVTINNT